MRTLAHSLRRVAFATLGFAALAAQAGGPLSICNGQPVKYPGAGTVTLNYDGGAGGLGPLTKAQADAAVTSAVSLWTNVNTATVTLARGADLPVDVTVANYTSYLNSFSDGLNPIIYDTDGSIVDDLLGVGSKNSVLGFAGSAYNGATCTYIEGRGVISGYLLSQGLPQIQINVAFAHEVGHLIGMDHSQLDTAQGLASNNTPLMYPIAQRGTLTLGDDDISAVTALYPDTNVNTVYGQISGNFTLANGVTPLPGANIWAREQTSGKAYSVVSDYLTQGTGFFKMLLPAGTYTLHAEAIQSRFDGGSSVGPFSETYPTDPSFQPPLYVSGAPMAPVTLGNSVPTQFSINPGCAATVTFTLAGTGTIGGNCTNKATPSITVGSSANPSNVGTTNVFTAVLSGSAGTPTGTVAFRDGSTTLAACSSVTMSSGSAVCTITGGLAAGSHPITAVYSGDTNYIGITSSTLPQTVNAAPALPTPSITVGSSANPAPSGTSVVITAVLSGPAGSPTGTVLFRDGSTTVSGCSAVALSTGRANCTMSSLSVGTHPITAVYSGDVNYTGVTSSTLPQSITGTTPPAPVNPSITVGSSANPAASGTSVVITAVLSGSAGTPTGTVLFRDGSVTVSGCSAVALASGRANCTMSGLSVGTHPITAVYSGDASYNAITSSTLPQSITGTTPPSPVTPSITVGSSQNPAPSGTSVVITAVLSGTAGTPTGTVLFRDGSTTVAGCSAVAMSAGRANCTMSGLTVGTHPITAVYSGDASYLAITSSTLPQTITAITTPAPITPSITVGSSQNPAPSGTSVVIVAVLSGSNGTPTGTVLFRDGSVTVSGCSAVALVAGRANCTMSTLSVGTHPITAVYSGDSAYTSLSSSTLPQSITGGTTPTPATPSITVGSSANPSLLNAPVTVTAVISGGNGTATGTVMFQDGTTTIAGCSGVVLSAGRANCTLNGLAAGLHPITAFYSGDANYFALASSTLPQTVSSTPAPTQATPSITVGSSQNPATVGTTITFVAVISGAVGTPTGTFQFRDGSTTLPGCSAVVLSAGRANCVVTGLTLGMHPITALYSGDSAYVPLVSSTLPQTMN